MADHSIHAGLLIRLDPISRDQQTRIERTLNARSISKFPCACFRGQVVCLTGGIVLRGLVQGYRWLREGHLDDFCKEGRLNVGYVLGVRDWVNGFFYRLERY